LTDTFFDKPINGDISHYTEGQAVQHDPQEFIDALDALVNLPHVVNVRWEQYTPYFNDGDACVFGTHEFVVLLDNSDEEDGDYGDGYLDAYSLYRYKEGFDWTSGEEGREYRYGVGDASVDTTEIYKALQHVGEIVDHHYSVLSDKFGDPAQVVYDGESFNVEYYDHD